MLLLRSGVVLTTLAAVVLTGCPSTKTPDPPVPPDAPSWSVDPLAVVFAPIAVGESRASAVTIRNGGKAALTVTVEPVMPTSAAFTAELARPTLEPGTSATLTVRFAPTEPGAHTGRLRLRPSDAALAPVEIALSGATVGETVVVSTAAVDFGVVVVGAQGHQQVTLTNPLDTPLTVYPTAGDDVESCDASPRTAHFCFAALSRPIGADGRLTLAARESIILDLAFAPRIAGVRELGDLSFRACAGDACPDVTRLLVLEGTGVASALRCDTARLDFGRVGTTACAERAVTCTNLGSAQRGVLSTALDPTRTSTTFTLVDPPGLFELGPGESRRLDVRYCPGGAGADSGVLVLATDDPDPAHRALEIPLAGSGGGPDLDVTPGALDFAVSAVGTPARRALTLSNRGDEDLVIANVARPAEVALTGDVTTPLAGGESRTLTVDLTLATAGAFTGALRFTSNDPDEPEITVALTGEGRAVPPCAYEVVPGTALEFGLVELTRNLTRAVEVRNVGSTECILSAARLLPSGDAAFSLADRVDGWTIAPGSSVAVGVTLSPLGPGARRGTLELSLSSPTAPIATVDLAGVGDVSPLLLSPHELGFGVIDLGCRARSRPVAIYNTGTTPVPVVDIRMAEPASPAFTLSGVPALTATIAPGGFIELEVGFRAAGAAEYAGAIEVVTGTTAATQVTYIIPLRGRGAPDGIQVDDFDQLGEPQVDIVWIIDDSGSMSEEQASLAANFLSFIRFADAQGLDYHMAITTTDTSGGSSAENGRFVPLTGSGVRIVTPRTQPTPTQVFTQNARVGTGGSGSERGLDAAYLALSNPLLGAHNAGFLRPQAALSVVVVSDEEDGSTRTVDFYVSFLLGIKGLQNANTFTFSAIVGDAPSGCSGAGGSASAGLRYIEVAERTGGVVQSICTPDWARALENVSTTAFGFKSRFVLSGQPVVDTVVVAVDGASVPPVDAQGAQRWSYDAGANAVVFTPYATPEPGAQIRVQYRAECL